MLKQQLKFTKMHGLGNDFMVIDAVTHPVHLSKAQIQTLANRRLGIGFDQLLMVEPADTPDSEFRYRIFNADGGEVEQCGNGARCFARFVHDNHLTKSTRIPVTTTNGRIILELLNDNRVTVDMGEPELTPSAIPFIFDKTQNLYTVQTADKSIELSAVSMGNPHAVLLVEDIDTAPVQALGAELEAHSAFPKRVNVGFMQILTPQHIRLRVFERGVGETQACGTGACAAVVAGYMRQLLDNQVQVDLTGGSLQINWQGLGTSVKMTGSATTVFTGEIVI